MNPIIMLNEKQFIDLPEYSTSLPTGINVGKKWKVFREDHWVMGEYVKHTEPHTVGIRWWDIEILTKDSRIVSVLP